MHNDGGAGKLKERAAGRPGISPKPDLRDEFAKQKPATDTTIGEVIERRYLIMKRVGGGGMGEVYAAKDLETGGDVALKIISKSIISDPALRDEYEKRFFREVKTTMSVSNRYVIDMRGMGAFGNNVFCVMELLHGQNLEDLMLQEGNGIAIGRFLRLVPQMCEGVQAAHDKGIVHRDLKPQNIFITGEGIAETVKVMDFGIAKFQVEDEDSKVTRTGILIGTPRYISPEQVCGSVVDHRSDVYLLGVLMYEMLTGAPPFTGNVHELTVKHLYEAPVLPTKIRPDIPKPIERVVMKALEKKPENRFQSVNELKEAVESYQKREPEAPARTSRPPPVPVPAYLDDMPRGNGMFGKVVGGIVLAGLLAAGTVAYLNREQVEGRAEAVFSEIRGQMTKKEEPQPAAETDSTYLLTVKTRPEGALVYEVLPDNKNGAYMSRAPFQTSIQKGEHKLRITMRGYKEQAVTVSETANAVDITLHRKQKKHVDSEDMVQEEAAEGVDTAANE